MWKAICLFLLCFVNSYATIYIADKQSMPALQNQNYSHFYAIPEASKYVGGTYIVAIDHPNQSRQFRFCLQVYEPRDRNHGLCMNHNHNLFYSTGTPIFIRAYTIQYPAFNFVITCINSPSCAFEITIQLMPAELCITHFNTLYHECRYGTYLEPGTTNCKCYDNFPIVSNRGPYSWCKRCQSCVYSEWVESACSVTCGTGQKTFTRQVLSGLNCQESLQYSDECTVSNCNRDCEMSEWVPRTCSHDCGTGTRIVERTILSPAVGSGVPCPINNVRSEVCNTQSCDGALLKINMILWLSIIVLYYR